MKFYRQLYISKSIKKNAFQIKYMVFMHPLKSPYYIICLAKNTDQLDIFHSRYIVQRYYKKNPPYIVGIAKNKEDAFLLVQEIVEDIYQKTNSANVKEYFIHNSKIK